MKIVVRYFAAAREATGTEAESLDIAAGTTVGELQSALESRHPKLDGLPLRFAVGLDFAPPERALEDDDEVAVIPPVSGG